MAVSFYSGGNRVNRIRLVSAVMFFLLVSGMSQGAVLLDRVVAIVNHDVITWSELYKSMEADASPKLKELSTDERRKIFRENEAYFLEMLINGKLQLQEAKTVGLRVSDEELQEAVNNIKKKYSMTDTALSESLKSEGFTYDEYKKRLWEQIMIGKVVAVQVRNRIVVTDDDIRRFLSDNREALDAMESYTISQIFFKRQKNGETGSIEEKAGELLGKLEKGESFSDLAKQYSEDPSSRTGGQLGTLKKNQLGKEFIEILSTMKPGDVSRPFWTERGLHIIKLESGTAPRSTDEVWEEAKKMLNNKIFTEKYNAWIKSLREKSFIEVKL